MFASNLRAARNKSGLSQRAVAEKLFVSAQAVGKWERGEATPSPEALAQLAILFGTTADDLLGLDKNKNPTGIPDEVLSAAEAFMHLPPEAQKEARAYLDFLKQRYAKQKD